MFKSIISNLKSEIDTLKRVLILHDSIRANLNEGSTDTDFWKSILEKCPKKVDWQIFDHCAGFTRLYALYEQCITDLLKEYLQLLPELFPEYSSLPDKTRTQHHVAVGQILQKWSTDGPFRLLTEAQIVKGLSNGLIANQRYELLPDAFLIDPQNYRSEILKKLFNYIGFKDCWSAIKKYEPVVNYLQEKRDANETPETILHDIVEHRNTASHSSVTSVVSLEELLSYADFIPLIASALTDMLTKEVWRRKIATNQASKVALVLKIFGDAIGVFLEPGEIHIGDELVASFNNSVFLVTVKSIQKLSTPHQSFTTTFGEEIGLVLSKKIREKVILYRL